MKTTILVLLTIHLTTVVHGVKFCLPTQMSASQYGAGTLFGMAAFEANRVYYDAINHKFAASGEIVFDERKTEVKQIDNYNATKRYLITPSTRECIVSTIGSDFPELCVQNAEELLSTYVGVGNNKLNVKSFSFPINAGFFDVRVLMLVTTPGYFPISLDVRGKYNNTNYFEIVNFLQVSPNITDDTIFDPPDYCNQLSASQYGADTLFGMTAFEAHRVYYDAINHKFAASGEIVFDERKTEVKQIDNYNATKRYIITPSTRECIVSAIGSNFPEFCVQDAEELESTYVGVGENKLNVKSFSFPINVGFYDVRVLMLVTTPGYFPISLDMRGKYNNSDYFEIGNFLQVSPNITDDTIFDPPDYCNQASTIMEQTEDTVLRWHSSLK